MEESRSIGTLSLWLVPWRNQVLHKLAFEISLEIDFNSSKHLVHIVLQVCDSLLSTLILVAPGLK